MLLFLRVGGLVKIVNICECYRYLLCCHYLFTVATAKHQIAIIFFIVFVAPYYEKRHFRIVNYPYLKKQASEEDSLDTQASNPQVLSFPTYPCDILCHVYERDPVARQATPVFHR